jgi:hypothetical protein
MSSDERFPIPAAQSLVLEASAWWPQPGRPGHTGSESCAACFQPRLDAPAGPPDTTRHDSACSLRP